MTYCDLCDSSIEKLRAPSAFPSYYGKYQLCHLCRYWAHESFDTRKAEAGLMRRLNKAPEPPTVAQMEADYRV